MYCMTRIGPMPTVRAGSFLRIESVEEWLDEHEAKHAGLTPLQEEFKRYLGQEEPGTPDT